MVYPLLPAVLGGAEADPVTQIEVIEALGQFLLGVCGAEPMQ